MRVKLGYAVPLVVLALLAVAFWRGLGRDPTYVPSPLIGKPVPAFSLPSLLDPATTVTQADLQGQVSLLNVWGTWCPGCRAEHQVLLDLEREGVRIVGLDWKDDAEAARRWLAELGDPYALVAYDGAGSVGIDLGVYGAPETFIVDRKGVIRHKHIGALTPEDVATTIRPLLRQLEAEAP